MNDNTFQPICTIKKNSSSAFNQIYAKLKGNLGTSSSSTEGVFKVTLKLWELEVEKLQEWQLHPAQNLEKAGDSQQAVSCPWVWLPYLEMSVLSVCQCGYRRNAIPSSRTKKTFWNNNSTKAYTLWKKVLKEEHNSTASPPSKNVDLSLLLIHFCWKEGSRSG